MTDLPLQNGNPHFFLVRQCRRKNCDVQEGSGADSPISPTTLARIRGKEVLCTRVTTSLCLSSRQVIVIGSHMEVFRWENVERRRRDKINNWIVQLSKIIPDCNTDNTKTGASKGGILSKACDYIRELRQTNQRMQETFKEAERLQMDNDLLRQQVAQPKFSALSRFRFEMVASHKAKYRQSSTYTATTEATVSVVKGDIRLQLRPIL
ncbi:PREDICTED: upstream stimulatory factor 1-like [Thamnophis sirtalis]|uniref:Upstream stimulatory factor 1-like n=1 Tax=Thamnophis sirtalis TaxID=35019 RepID=A0A6I9YG56_9SAUR|nr:PREDICTED: upstream stimulatory factor 1-like [Thamnophis sirtalis]